MTLSFADAPGNLYNRIGRLGKIIMTMDSYQTSQLTNYTDTTVGAVAQYDSESDLQALIGSNYIGALNSAGGIGGTLQNLAVQTINRMIFRDTPQIFQNLQSVNITSSMEQLIFQMGQAGATVLAHVLTATPTSVVGFGNGGVVVSLRRPSDCRILEYTFAETVTFTCSSDSYTGGATAGNEPFDATGTGAQGNVFAFDWPLGSNASGGYDAVDGDSDNSNGNILTNSGFTDWTDDVPDNWELVTGTAGVNIAQEVSIVYDNSESSCAFIGDGSTKTEIRQLFDSDEGTVGAIEALTQYAFVIFVRRDGVAAATGTLTVALRDEDGNVINDQSGTPNSFDIDLTNLTVLFAAYTGTFRTPRVMPVDSDGNITAYLSLRQTVALENGRTVYCDRGSLATMQQFYNSGPYFSVYSGSTPYQQGDFMTCVITNNRDGSNDLNDFGTLFCRLLPDIMMSNEFLLPSSSTPTISSTLITS